MAEKCKKKHDAHAKLLFCLSKPIAFLPFLLPLLSSLHKLPTNQGNLHYICDTGYPELVHKIDQTEMIFLCRTQTNLANLSN